LNPTAASCALVPAGSMELSLEDSAGFDCSSSLASLPCLELRAVLVLCDELVPLMPELEPLWLLRELVEPVVPCEELPLIPELLPEPVEEPPLCEEEPDELEPYWPDVDPPLPLWLDEPIPVDDPEPCELLDPLLYCPLCPDDDPAPRCEDCDELLEPY